MERHNIKYNKQLTKSQKFWRSFFGKVLQGIANFFYDMLCEFFNPRPEPVYSIEAFAIIINKHYDELIREYNNDKRANLDSRRNFWRRRMGNIKRKPLTR